VQVEVSWGERGRPAAACVRYERHSVARSVKLLKKRAVQYTAAPVPAAAKRAGRVKSESLKALLVRVVAFQK
jgi:hypothetical protein